MPREQVEAFFRAHNMHYEAINPESCKEDYLSEMRKGLGGKDSSLFMLPTYLPLSETLPLEEPVIVIDAGGTNFRVALLTFHADKEPSIKHFSKAPMPGTGQEVSGADFFFQMADHVQPLLSYSDYIGFTFSFPVEILPSKDGRLLYLSKELQVEEAVGQLIGERLNEEFARRGLAHKKITLLNDTVAALLGGIAQHNPAHPEKYLGFIYGTGLNTCYPEKSRRILKSPEAMGGSSPMVINMESGGYVGFPRGTFDVELDATTHSPEKFLFEKMCSGAYLGQLIHLTTLGALKEGLFSPPFGDGYPYTEAIPLWDVNDFLKRPEKPSPLVGLTTDPRDRETLFAVIDLILRRCGKLTAIHFGAIFQQMGLPTTLQSPYVITIEGTTFEKTLLLQKHLAHYMDKLVTEAWGHEYKIIHVENVTLLGSAVAGLTK